MPTDDATQVCGHLTEHDQSPRAFRGVLRVLTDEVRTILLNMHNLRHTKQLPSTLPLYHGMRLLLYSKECVRLQLMNGCLCELVDTIFADEEALPNAVYAGEPILLEYMPSHLLLRAVGAKWTLAACLLYTSPSPRDGLLSRMPSSA